MADITDRMPTPAMVVLAALAYATDHWDDFITQIDQSTEGEPDHHSFTDGEKATIRTYVDNIGLNLAFKTMFGPNVTVIDLTGGI